ncbi:RNA-binding protein [Paenisporosarcina quisquiliarum]|uniref:RNA-binding protein n=1 Tax=Paenisporosarcina quisquiliarum TaxID=365346 RepID=A0A9X3LCQ1_9BACL|nr:RNA-binding protein [Paenisporosarcina quisquiliarum]MCZ8535568.1 RNA-binding protein [Paenisporosarcina quisquiliarum]
MEQVLQHFRKDEQPFIEQVSGWLRETQDRYAPKLTDFLDPRQQFIVHAIIGQSEDLVTTAFGEFPEAERKRMLIAPSYFEATEDDYDIVMFSIKYPSKFIKIEHPDVLGSLMSLGLDRSKFGDIRVDDNQIEFAVASEVADFVRMHLTSIGKAKVHVEELQSDHAYLENRDVWVEETHTVSSMRIDTIIASLFNVSRQKASMLVHGGKVKVNWTVREQPSFELHESDLLSIRGYGRIRIGMIEGRTKKDKIRLQIGRIEQNS